jgi:hypothetical protein
MKSMNISEDILVFLFNPPWRKISVALVAIAGVAGLVISQYNSPTVAGLWSTILVGGLSACLFIFSSIVSRTVSGIEITCIQNRPSNSAENHHKNRFKMNDGVGHLHTYIEIPDWVSGFRIKIKTDPEIEVIPFNRLPRPVTYEENTLKSDYYLPEFPLILKLSGDPEDLGEGEYYFKFKDKKINTKIKEMTLKCDPDPSTADERNGDDLDEWF